VDTNEHIDVIIVGAGGLGRELFIWVGDMIATRPGYKIKGFLDDDLSALDNFDYNPGILGSIRDYKPSENERFVLGIGTVELKEEIATLLEAKGAEFMTVVHPSVVKGKNSKLGRGCIICPNSILSGDTQLGNFVTVNLACIVSHDVVIGDWTQLSPLCNLTGNVTVGSRVFMGASACVLPGINVGNRTILGAGTVCVRNIPENVTCFGVPARILPKK